MGLKGFDRLVLRIRQHRELDGWLPYQAAQNKTAKNVFSFFASFFSAPSFSLQAAA